MVLNKAQLELLRLLSERDSEQGVFFARWDEIRSANYAEQWLQDNKDAPNLDWQSERAFLELVEQELVDELEKWGTKEGKHYRITSLGIKVVQGSHAKLIPKIWPMFRRLSLWVVLPLAAAWLLFLFGPDLGIVEILGSRVSD